MSINLLIGKINKDGTVDAITVRRDGGINHKKCLYKYYRSPERVSALIRNGITRDPLAIYINRKEMDPSSPLYNEEVTMLPINIGFPDKDFYATMDPYQNIRPACQFPSVKEYLQNAERVGFYDHDVFLYNPETELWTEGKAQNPIRETIIADWQATYYNTPEWVSQSLEELIEQMDAIDEFIAKRKQQKSAPEVTGVPQATDEHETQIEEEQPIQEVSNSLENANIYLLVVEQIGYEQRERKIVNLPITKELENMKVSEIAALIGVKNATVEIYHDKEGKKPASSAYLSTWVPFAKEVTVKNYAIFSLMESIENRASMIRTMRMSGNFVDERRKQEILAELSEKENLALNALRTVIDEETLKVAVERIRKLNSPVGIYDLIDELGILKKDQSTGIKMPKN